MNLSTISGLCNNSTAASNTCSVARFGATSTMDEVSAAGASFVSALESTLSQLGLAPASAVASAAGTTSPSASQTPTSGVATTVGSGTASQSSSAVQTLPVAAQQPGAHRGHGHHVHALASGSGATDDGSATFTVAGAANPYASGVAAGIDTLLRAITNSPSTTSVPSVTSNSAPAQSAASIGTSSALSASPTLQAFVSTLQQNLAGSNSGGTIGIGNILRTTA